MTEKTRSKPIQLNDVIERLERLEAIIASVRSHDSNQDATATQQLCTLKKVPERVFSSEVSLERARLILSLDKKWVNGTKLRYSFFDSGSWSGGNDQMDLVRQGFEVWKNVGIGITFEEMRNINEADIRIGFLRGDGAWSYVGRDVRDIPGQGERTMNFGWDLRTDPRRENVAVHEIGHTLGFPHEHQNPFSGIVWNEEAVYDYFGGPPNSWSREETFYNVLRKLTQSEVDGSNWDSDSIMHYAFAAGLIVSPEDYRNGLTPAGGLSQQDLDTVRRFYPPLEEDDYSELTAFRSEILSLAPAEQKNFVIRPTASRNYTIQTFGGTDTVMVLFEDQNEDLKYVQGDDDSGTNRNALIRVRLYQGRRYVLRIRLYLNVDGGDTAVMMW